MDNPANTPKRPCLPCTLRIDGWNPLEALGFPQRGVMPPHGQLVVNDQMEEPQLEGGVES